VTDRGRAASRRPPGGALILVCNAGSSTLKASLLAARDAGPVASTTLEWGGPPAERASRVVDDVLDAFGIGDGHELAGVGHRLVHGGPEGGGPAVIDAATRRRLDDLRPLAPLHLPPALAVIDAARTRLPRVRHVAAFDTAFHASLPEVARRYPLPGPWVDELGLRRYGFHGLSVDWATGRAAELLGTSRGRIRLVVAHLGAGSSVTAVDRGRSVDTSMGYTPLEGLMMATRSGSIDPGIVIALLRVGHDVEAIADGLEHRSGLLAIGGSADLRTLVDRAAAGDGAASLAIDLFVDRAAAGIAAAATRLRRLDAVVFTGGIGEGAAGVRAAIVRRLAAIGVPAIPARRRRGDVVLGGGGAHPAVLQVVAREDLVIAAAVRRRVRTPGG
jgi:acetate kinase